MRRVVIAALVAGVAAAYPTWAGAATFKGVVVAKSHARGTIAVASTRGGVHTLHVRKSVRVGAKVTATAARRADGTYTTSRLVVRGRAHHARIHGVVAARTSTRFLLSAGKSMIVVRLHTAARALASARDNGPQVGDDVETEVDIDDDGDLDEESTEEKGEQSTVEVEGTVVAVSASSLQVKTEGGMTVTVTIPTGMTVNAAVGDEVELEASVQGTTLTLVSIEDEENEDEGGGDDSD